jgi:hypothetical protein
MKLPWTEPELDYSLVTAVIRVRDWFVMAASLGVGGVDSVDL